MSAIRHGTAPFPVGEVSTASGNAKLLGMEIYGVEGKECTYSVAQVPQVRMEETD